LNGRFWLYCESVAEAVPAARLAIEANLGRPVDLRFPLIWPDEAAWAALLARLSAEFPDHSVFANGSKVIVLPVVVTRARVLERQAEVVRAIAEYWRTCAELVGRYRAGTLPREWWSDEHGEHCRFENQRKGQVVEAPLWELAEPFPVDPYFFALFIKTTAGLESVAESIEREFHDGARILGIVASDAHC
jgi:hypothetical protein